MTFILWYFGGVITTILLNYALHQPNKELEEKLNNLEDNLYRNSGH